jgi:ribosome-associated protein
LTKVEAARQALLAKKGEDIRILDVRGLSTLTDYYVVVTGNSAPHLKALLGEVERVLLDQGLRCYRRAGTAESHWMVADYFDFVVHVLSPDMRARYAFEQLWRDAQVVA